MHDPTTVLRALNVVMTTIRKVTELARSSKDSELKARVSELYDGVLQLKVILIEQQNENHTLRQRLEQKEKVKRGGEFGYYFLEGDPDPFCPRCKEKDEKLIHLSRHRNSGGRPCRDCNVCGEVYFEKPATLSSAHTPNGPWRWT